jgi:hypothetical protein
MAKMIRKKVSLTINRDAADALVYLRAKSEDGLNLSRFVSNRIIKLAEQRGWKPPERKPTT